MRTLLIPLALIGLVGTSVVIEYLAEKGYSVAVGTCVFIVMLVCIIIQFKKKLKFPNLTRKHE